MINVQHLFGQVVNSVNELGEWTVATMGEGRTRNGKSGHDTNEGCTPDHLLPQTTHITVRFSTTAWFEINQLRFPCCLRYGMSFVSFEIPISTFVQNFYSKKAVRRGRHLFRKFRFFCRESTPDRGRKGSQTL